MTELTSNRLLDFIANTAIGGWWRKTLSELEQANGIEPKQSERPVPAPDALTPDEMDRVMDFAHRGIGTLGDVEQLLERLPWRMSVDLRQGHLRALERLREEAREQAKELRMCRARLRERGREAREEKARRLADDRSRC